MMSRILNARITFRTTPVHILEKFRIRDHKDAYRRFRESGLDECVIVQTCNRVELFGRAPKADYTGIIKTWSEVTGLDNGAFGDLETGEDTEAIRHLLDLVAGLDSMVIGEEQVLGQVKDSIATAKDAGASGMHLNTLFDRAARVGSRIRNVTGIGKEGISVGSMAVRLAEENMDDIGAKRLLMIGTGEVATLVAKSLARRGYDFSVASRTMQRARAFCEVVGGRPVKFEDVLADFGRYEVSFVATTAPFSLVTYETVAALAPVGGMIILDLSNPRAVDERIATVPGVKLMNLDQIGEMVERNMKDRANKAKAIQSTMGEEVSALEASMHRLEAEPLVKEVFHNMEDVRARELAKAIQMMGDADPRTIRIMTDMSKALLEGMASTPMNNIRRASEQGDTDVLEKAARIFDYGSQ